MQPFGLSLQYDVKSYIKYTIVIILLHNILQLLKLWGNQSYLWPNGP